MISEVGVADTMMLLSIGTEGCCIHSNANNLSLGANIAREKNSLREVLLLFSASTIFRATHLKP